jgi:hypothetical protein
LILAGLFFSMPVDQPLDKNGKIDFVGSLLGLTSLILFSVVWKYVMISPPSALFLLF